MYNLGQVDKCTIFWAQKLINLDLTEGPEIRRNSIIYS